MIAMKHTLASLLLSIPLLLACRENDRESDLSPTPEPVSTEAAQPTVTPTAATDTPTPVPSPTFFPQNVILPTVPVPTIEPNIGSIISKELAAAAIRMNSVRGLSSGTLVNREFLSAMEFKDVMSDLLETSRSAIESDQLLYETLGLMEGEENLYDLTLTLNSEGVLGFFDLDKRTLYVVGDEGEVTHPLESTYVHEYVHHLQEANFDIGAKIDAATENMDAVRAMEAVAEGSARIAEIFYINRYMSPEEKDSSQPELPEAVREALDVTPYAAIRMFAFPFVEGVDFAVNLYQEGEGWDLVNGALEQPPVSTEQILHSEKYIEGELPISIEIPELGWILGGGWEHVRTNRLGEFFIRAWLETDFSPVEAATASIGWGGDAYSLFRGPDGQGLLVLLVVWDSIQDANEFFDTVQRHTEERTGVMWNDSQTTEDAAAISLPDRTMYVKRKDAATLMIVAPDPAYTETVRQYWNYAGGWSPRSRLHGDH